MSASSADGLAAPLHADPASPSPPAASSSSSSSAAAVSTTSDATATKEGEGERSVSTFLEERRLKNNRMKKDDEPILAAAKLNTQAMEEVKNGNIYKRVYA